MSWWNRISRSNFLIRLKSWEYWPFGIIQFPAMIYWLWLSLYCRSLVFFSASNPGIPMGGMFGESKFDILKRIPGQYVPKTLLASPLTGVAEILKVIAGEGMKLPLIFKPDLGERGYMVTRINSENDVSAFLENIRGEFIIQELVDLPMEFGVFYMRMPTEETGRVTSVVVKEMLSVTGDGSSTLQELIMANDRAKLQWKKLKRAYGPRLRSVLAKDEKFELVSIGNHALGTKFIDGSHLINEHLSRTFDDISGKIAGFYFGRFDLRCASLEDLYQGNIRIMELNGCGAEPVHIYDPDFSLWKAVCVHLAHWRSIFDIAQANRRLGVKYISLKDAFRHYRKFKSLVK